MTAEFRTIAENDIWQARADPVEMKARVMEAFRAGAIDADIVSDWFLFWGLDDK